MSCTFDTLLTHPLHITFNTLYIHFFLFSKKKNTKQSEKQTSSSLSILTQNFGEMGRIPCCEKDNVKRGQWTPEEDHKLSSYIAQHGTCNWRLIPKHTGLFL